MALEHTITPGHLLRHIPPGSSVGREVALLDIAQDFLLTEMHRRGFFDGLLVFKGGTALRKHFAGAAGRFSTDLDFAAGGMDVDREAAAELVARELDGNELGPFRISVRQRRGRWLVDVESSLGAIGIPLKLDVGPPCWLMPDCLPFVQAPIHNRYGFELPALPTMPLVENLAEKIARLMRVSVARDASDLVWAATTSPHSRMDRHLVRRIALLKVWVDNNGLDGHWRSANAPRPFSAETWLRRGRNWDDELIGSLAHPPPRLEDLELELIRYYDWLVCLDGDETMWARCTEDDRAQIVRAITDLPGAAITAEEFWGRNY